MSSERLFRFPKPQWLNSANTRTAGVYLAGGMVCAEGHCKDTWVSRLTRSCTVLDRPLRVHRRSDMVKIPPKRLRLPHELR